MPDVLALELPCDRQAPGRAREALARFAEVGWRLGDVMLIASELVTNAVMHSGCAEDEAIEVRVSMDGEHLRIAVRDPGRSGQDARLGASEALGGWGLQIVEQLAQRWGAERAEDYHVWAEIDLSQAAF